MSALGHVQSFCDWVVYAIGLFIGKCVLWLKASFRFRADSFCGGRPLMLRETSAEYFATSDNIHC